MATMDAVREKRGLLSELPQRLHHHAFVVRDQEVNRQFFEDLLGIPLVATWCESHHNSWLGREVAMCHTFFSMADGGALAFFAFGDPEIYQLVIAEKPAVVGNFDHVAFKVSDRTYDELVKPPGPAIKLPWNQPLCVISLALGARRRWLQRCDRPQ